MLGTLIVEFSPSYIKPGSTYPSAKASSSWIYSLSFWPSGTEDPLDKYMCPEVKILKKIEAVPTLHASDLTGKKEYPRKTWAGLLLGFSSADMHNSSSPTIWAIVFKDSD